MSLDSIRPQKREKGFTLIELLIVVSIVAILGSIAIPKYLGYVEKAKVVKARSTINQIVMMVVVLGTDTDLWPGGQTPNQEAGGPEYEDLTAGNIGLFNNDDGIFSYWQGPYLPTNALQGGQFLDPWGTPYFMDYDYDIDPAPGNQSKYAIVVGSYGPNKVGNNQYDSDDIYLVIAQ